MSFWALLAILRFLHLQECASRPVAHTVRLHAHPLFSEARQASMTICRLALRVFRSTVVVPSRLTAKGEPAKLTDVETGMARGASPHRGPMPGGIVLQQSRPVPRD